MSKIYFYFISIQEEEHLFISNTMLTKTMCKLPTKFHLNDTHKHAHIHCEGTHLLVCLNSK